jgi:hypothetical protein
MKKIIIILILAFPTGLLADSAYLYNRKGERIAKIRDGYIYKKPSESSIGKVDRAGRIRTRSGETLGRIRDNKIVDRRGNVLMKYRNGRFYDRRGNSIAKSKNKNLGGYFLLQKREK